MIKQMDLMHYILPGISLVQGVVLITASFLQHDSKRDLVAECNTSKLHAVHKYVTITLGMLLIALALAKLFKIIKIPLLVYAGIIITLALGALTLSVLDRKCLASWLIIEQVVEVVLYVGIVAIIVYGSRRARNN